MQNIPPELKQLFDQDFEILKKQVQHDTWLGIGLLAITLAAVVCTLYGVCLFAWMLIERVMG